MGDINSVVQTGRLTKDAKITQVGGTSLAEFSIAVEKSIKKDGEWIKGANFFDIKLWGKTVDSIGKYLVKGTKVGVSGELDQETWEKDGKKNSTVKIRASNIALLGSKPSDGPDEHPDIPF